MDLKQAMDNIYNSLQNDNQDIDLHIANLKAALPAGRKNITVEPARLPYNNRQGRKMMQSYFKRHGVTVNFSE